MSENHIYTASEVHQIVEQVLCSLGTAHLDNDIPQKASPADTKMTWTVREAAGIIGISKPKMYELVRAGRLRSVKVGKKILISRQSLRDWVQEGDNHGKKTC